MAQITALRPTDPRALGAYRLAGRLGEGGQGVVYAAHAPDETPVAVKTLRDEWTGDGRVRERFAKEVAAARRVAPFCVAQVLDADLEADPPFIVTEFVDGPTLLEAVRDGGPRTGAALHRLAVATATALAAIHEAGVVHRDFKPANVLLGADGPRVIDFGIARTLDGAATHTGGIVGTPAYMAPEQFEDRPIGPAADVFAWGCVIVFAATGASPFGGGSVAAVSHRVLRTEPDLSGLTGPLHDVVVACLAKDERARPSMRDILLWLLGRPDGTRAPIGEALAAGRLTAVSAVPPVEPPRTFAYEPGTVPGSPRRGSRAAVIGAGAALAAVIVAVAAVTYETVGRDSGGGTDGRTPSPTASASVVNPAGGLPRSPRLGLELWQNGGQDPMTYGQRNGKDVVTVTMKKAPFEFRFPKLAPDVALEVCAWTDDGIFSIKDGDTTEGNPSFAPGTGFADFEYGSGTLFVDDQGHNQYVGTRVSPLSSTEDRVYISQTDSDRVDTPLSKRDGDLYLTVFIDKNKDGRFQVTDPAAEFEFFVLRF